MKYFLVLFGLVNAATAIDIRFGDSFNCDGWAFECSNWNPDNCCSVYDHAPLPRVSFAAFPKDWPATTILAFKAIGCNAPDQIAIQSTTEDVCLEDPSHYASAKYTFTNQKKAREAGDGECAAGASGGKCQTVDTVRLEDGSKFSIRHLNEPEIKHLVERAKGGTLDAAVKEFKLPRRK